MKSKRTKALDISRKTKEKVFERDGGCCIICGTPYAMPNAHYIPRSKGGLGIEQNIVTLCIQCHHNFDNTPKRKQMKGVVKNYLQSQYDDWNEDDLFYQK